MPPGTANVSITSGYLHVAVERGWDRESVCIRVVFSADYGQRAVSLVFFTSEAFAIHRSRSCRKFVALLFFTASRLSAAARGEFAAAVTGPLLAAAAVGLSLASRG